MCATRMCYQCQDAGSYVPGPHRPGPRPLIRREDNTALRTHAVRSGVFVPDAATAARGVRFIGACSVLVRMLRACRAAYCDGGGDPSREANARTGTAGAFLALLKQGSGSNRHSGPHLAVRTASHSPTGASGGPIARLVRESASAARGRLVASLALKHGCSPAWAPPHQAPPQSR